jgi:DNA-directed RNA polymerase subunit M/transcription elongation factor TFIIS
MENIKYCANCGSLLTADACENAVRCEQCGADYSFDAESYNETFVGSVVGDAPKQVNLELAPAPVTATQLGAKPEAQVTANTNNPDSHLPTPQEGATAVAQMPAHQPQAGKKPLYKRWYLWAALALVLFGCVGAGVFGVYAMNHETMPDLTGVSPLDSQQRLEGLSDSWTIEFFLDSGEQVEVSEDSSYEDYEVKSTEPASLAVLDKHSNQHIRITIQKNAATLAIENERNEVMDSYVLGNQGKYGIAARGITYIDDGDLVIVTVKYINDSQDSWHNESFQQTEADMLAASMRTHVFICRYTSDGYLVEINAGLYGKVEDASEETKAHLLAKLQSIESAADEFAVKNRSVWMDATETELLNRHTADTGERSHAAVNFEEHEDMIWINVFVNRGLSYHNGSEEYWYAAIDSWQKIAESDSLYLRSGVGYRFIKVDGEIDLQVASEKQSYLYTPKNAA